MPKKTFSNRSNMDIDEWFHWNLDRKRRTIYVGEISFGEDGGRESGIDALMSEYFFKSMHILNSNKNPIKVVLNTSGGEWDHGMAIYDSIRLSRAPVDILGIGNVMSMGAVIMQAGRRRLLTPNCTFMVHLGYTGINEGLKHGDAKRRANYEEWLETVMTSIFAERSTKHPTKKYWTTKCKEDTFLDADEAVEEGLADKVLNYNGDNYSGSGPWYF